MNFISELKRLLPVFEAPGWVMKTLVGILAILALDADSAEAWAARGASLSKFRDTQVESRDAFQQAMRLNPNDPNASFSAFS